MTSSILQKLRGSSATPTDTSAPSTPTSTASGSPADGSSPETPSPTTDEPAPLDPWAPENLIPITVLAAELNGYTINTLIKKLGDDVILDDIGMRCTTRSAARALIAKRNASKAEQKRKEQQRRAESDKTRERIHAIQTSPDGIELQAQHDTPQDEFIDQRFGLGG